MERLGVENGLGEPFAFLKTTCGERELGSLVPSAGCQHRQLLAALVKPL